MTPTPAHDDLYPPLENPWRRHCVLGGGGRHGPAYLPLCAPLNHVMLKNEIKEYDITTIHDETTRVSVFHFSRKLLAKKL